MIGIKWYSGVGEWYLRLFLIFQNVFDKTSRHINCTSLLILKYFPKKNFLFCLTSKQGEPSSIKEIIWFSIFLKCCPHTPAVNGSGGYVKSSPNIWPTPSSMLQFYYLITISSLSDSHSPNGPHSSTLCISVEPVSYYRERSNYWWRRISELWSLLRSVWHQQSPTVRLL